MNELKFSITVLITYIIAVLGIANIEMFQESILDLSPIFFILIAIIVFSELILVARLIRFGVALSNYVVISFWIFVYFILWILDYAGFASAKPLQVHLIQLLLLVLTSVLTYDVGRRVGELDKTLAGLSATAYPNRAREIRTSRDLIDAEITRSRRYHHPLSVLTLRLQKLTDEVNWKDVESLAEDIFERLALAKASKIISELSRDTDMVFWDADNQFVVLCPETNLNSIDILAGRMEAAMEEGLGAKITWGSATFPDEALTFEDLLHVARERYSQSA